MRVKKAIDGLPGVSNSEVAIGSAAVTFDENRLKPEDLKAAVEKAGYKVIG
jgi:copper chaperone CopZ